MKSIICPSCGNNNVVIDESRDFAFCSYCSSQIMLKETVKVEHSGKVSVDGLSTVNSLITKGFIEIAARNLGGARKSFDKAMQIAPENVFASIGMMVVSDKPYYYSKIKERSYSISPEETSFLNADTCRAFAAAYWRFDDLERLSYVAEKYPRAITLDLFKLDYGIRTCHKNIDECNFFLSRGFSVNQVFDRFFGVATNFDASYHSFRTDVFTPSMLEKLLIKGFNPNNYYVKVQDKDRHIQTISVTLYFKKESTWLYRYDFVDESRPRLSGESDKVSPILYYNLLKKYRFVTETPNIEKSTPMESISKSLNKHGCYVATCCYGSYDCPQVWTLRRFRDLVLASTWYGRAFIRIYYAISPTLVRWFGSSKLFKKVCRFRLDKLVRKLNQNGMDDSPYTD